MVSRPYFVRADTSAAHGDEMRTIWVDMDFEDNEEKG